MIQNFNNLLWEGKKMFKKLHKNEKGFTLAELLIVVAIIGVLVAISIPIFTAQLNKSKYATDLANARSIYAELQADYLANGGSQTSGMLTTSTVSTGSKSSITVKEADGTQNVYNFTGIVGVTITTGTASATPKVEVSACTSAGASEAVSFGGTSISTSK